MFLPILMPLLLPRLDLEQNKMNHSFLFNEVGACTQCPVFTEGRFKVQEQEGHTAIAKYRNNSQRDFLIELCKGRGSLQTECLSCKRAVVNADKQAH